MQPDRSSAAYTLREAKALHEVGVAHHGWYMTEAEHYGVLDVLQRLEAALREIADHGYLAADECRRIAQEALADGS
jgi:hypothetical protein